MLNFITQRRWLFLAGALVALLALFVVSRAWAFGASLALVLGASTLIGGLAVVVTARIAGAIRVVFKKIGELEAGARATPPQASAQLDEFRTRLALVERRLAALAIKLDATEDLNLPDL